MSHVLLLLLAPAPDFLLPGFLLPDFFLDESVRETVLRYCDAEDGNYDAEDGGEIEDAEDGGEIKGTPEHDLKS